MLIRAWLFFAIRFCALLCICLSSIISCRRKLSRARLFYCLNWIVFHFIPHCSSEYRRKRSRSRHFTTIPAARRQSVKPLGPGYSKGLQRNWFRMTWPSKQNNSSCQKREWITCRAALSYGQKGHLSRAPLNEGPHEKWKNHTKKNVILAMCTRCRFRSVFIFFLIPWGRRTI